MKGRLVFVREYRLYHTNRLRDHIDHGDPGNDRQAEILPHPWCDFCQIYFFNDQQFFDHLSRQHLNCNLCPDTYKNVYYSEYQSLETHFSRSHHLCPFENCKLKCYVSFRTQDELEAHVAIEHKARQKVISANALLGFEYKRDDEDEEYGRGGRGRGGRGRGGKHE